MNVVNVYTPGSWDTYDSYGLIACQLARHISALGARVNAMGLGERAVSNQPADVQQITSQPIRPAYGGLLLGYPTTYAKYSPLASLGPRVAVTMFESTQLPAGWVDILNTCHAVVVPSHFCKEVFAANGVTVPIHVIPLGIPEVYQPYQRPATNGRPFTLLAFADRGRRKGGYHAMQAFVRAFGDDCDYRLILKARDTAVKHDILNPNIDAVQVDMTEQELYRLYCQCDVMVNANLGEGFGLIPREAAATGCITLATNWGGTADDLDAWGFPIAYTMAPAWKGHDVHEGLGEWAEPDVEALAVLMREIADYRRLFAEMAMEKAQRVHELYSWRRFAEGVYEVWKEAC